MNVFSFNIYARHFEKGIVTVFSFGRGPWGPYCKNWAIIFMGFSKKILRTTRFQLKLLISIESLSIFHWKPAKKNQTGCGLEAKFGVNYAQCCEKK